MVSINHDLKAIFIHIPKNGGTYISGVLNQYGFNSVRVFRTDHEDFSEFSESNVENLDNFIDSYSNSSFNKFFLKNMLFIIYEIKVLFVIIKKIKKK